MSSIHRLLSFVPPMLLCIAPVFAQLQGKIELLSGNQYRVSVIPQVNWAPPQSITNSAQITLRAPSSRLVLNNFQNLTGDWSAAAPIKSPIEAPGYDYFSVSLNSPISTVIFQQGIAIPLFSFSNTGNCVNIEIIEVLTDPFRPPNSLSVNIGNSFSVLGAGIGVNAYSGNTLESKAICPPLLITVNAANNPVPCNGSATNITVKASGGTAPYLLSWKNIAAGITGIDSLLKDGDSKILSNMKAGDYQVTIKDAYDSTRQQNISIRQPSPIKVVLHAFDASCNGSMDGVAFVDKTSGGTVKSAYKYYWETNPAISNPTAGFLNPGKYKVTVVDDNGCQAVDSIEVKTNGAIYPNLLISQIRCNGDKNGIIDLYPVGVNPPFNFIWSANANTGDFSSAWKLGPGTYTVTVTDATGVCNEVRTVTLNDPPPIILEYSLTAPGCGEDEGTLKLVTVANASGDWKSSLSGVTGFTNVKQYSLETGIPYHLIIKDAKGCSRSEPVQLPEKQQMFLELGADISMKYGERRQLRPEVFPLKDIKFEWSPIKFLSCSDCPDPIANPDENITYTLRMTDKLGCVVTDKINIEVRKSRDIFIPTAFSPNHDGINDQFCPYAGFEVTSIKSMQVFDRWGGLIYESSNIKTTGGNKCGWDGTSNGKVVDSGTYLYAMNVEFIDGQTILFAGEILLIR